MSLAAKIMLSPVLVAQAVVTRARLPRLPEPEGQRHGVIGRGPLLRVLITGDSSAAGVGVQQGAVNMVARHALPATPPNPLLGPDVITGTIVDVARWGTDPTGLRSMRA